MALTFVFGLVLGDHLASRGATPGPQRGAGQHRPHGVLPEALPYQNPVIDSDFPDPDVMWTGREYVAAATGNSSAHIQFATSSNLVDWRAGGDLLPKLPVWAVDTTGGVWGPALEHLGSSWILWFSAPTISTGRQCIGWATSSSVSGPYTSTSVVPALCQSALGGSIDPTVVTSAVGHRYLVWKNDGNCCGLASHIWSQPLAPDGTSLVGDATILLTYSGGWEAGPSLSQSTIEGPSMLRLHDHYVLFFSAGGYSSASYSMGVAACDSISGPCRLQGDGPVLASTAMVAGPGGGTAFFDRYGQPWMAYAAWTPPQVGYAVGGSRSFRLDRIVSVANELFILGPTTDGQRGPPTTVDTP